MRASIWIFIFAASFALPCRAQWAVIDVANLQQNIVNYAAMVQQIAKEGEQIANQVRQIQQMEDQLKRLGNMSDFRAIVGFPQLKLDLNLPTQIRNWADNVARVDGSRIFGDTRGGIFNGISGDFSNFDGVSITRDADLYRPTQAIATTVDNFKEVQSDVYTRRAQLKQAIAQTSEALQAAATDAEEKKLQAVLGAQYSELASLDSEVGLSAAEIQVKAAESSAMSQAQNAADAEARQKLAQQEAQKISVSFRPIYDQVLLYVKEEPFRP
jgi:hypothetical protein